MIRRLWLRHWKAYDRLELDLGPGTTFLVADNGIGKTSIVQGIHFAIFGGAQLLGSNSPISNAVRGGFGSTAEVGCQLTLGNVDVDIHRVVEKTDDGSASESEVRIDGNLSSDQALLSLLKKNMGVDSTQLALLAIVSEGSVLSTNDTGLDIASALSSALGVDRLYELADTYDRRARQLDRQTDDLRKNLRDSLRRADAKKERELLSQLATLETELDKLRSQADTIQRREVERSAWVHYRERQDQYQSAIRAERSTARSLISDARDAIPQLAEVPDATVDRAFIREALDAAAIQRDALARRRGHAEARLEQAVHGLTSLDHGSSVCPVCLRAMSDSEAHRAYTEHEHAATLARDELGSIEQDFANLNEIVPKLNTFVQSPAPQAPEPPISPQPVEADATSNASELRNLGNSISASEEKRQSIITELRVLERMNEQYEENLALSSSLLRGYRSAERAYLAALTMKRLAETASADRIAPLTREVEKRWADVWSAEPLTMSASGSLSLTANDHAIPYSEFSGGQRTLAHVIVRLLALQMATRSPFLVLDEPLEHLDPRNRRQLATLLVRATQNASSLRQIIVTTYEETVTRRLSTWEASDDSNVDRPAPSRVLRITSGDVRNIG